MPQQKQIAGDLESNFSMRNPVLAVQVHGTDQLKQDPYLSHPVVKVHVVDANTGAYLRKSKASIPCVNAVKQTRIELTGGAIQRVSGQCEHMTPLMTMPCNLGAEGRHGASLKFDEIDGRLLFGEHYVDTILKPKTLFLFEILDSVPGAPKSKLHEGWYRVAWGFLHAVSRHNGQPNITKSDKVAPKRLRLQLYEYMDNTVVNRALQNSWWKKTGHHKLGGLVPSVYFSYLSHKRIPYSSSTLYVSITGVRAPKKDRVYRRAMLPMEIERHRLGFADAIAAGETEQELHVFGEELDENTKRVLRRSRGEGEACLVPDTVASRIPTKRGCFGLSFSFSGKYLAASCRDDLMYPISIYEVDTGKPWAFGDFLGHHEIVYTLRWLKGDKMLASASGDGTVKLWNIPSSAWESPSKSKNNAKGDGNDDDEDANGGMTPRTAQRTAAAEASSQVVTLVHSPPCYVYGAVFHPMADPPLLLSCAFDGNIRLWNAMSPDDYHRSNDDRLYGKLQGGYHKTRVNCLAFDKRGLKLISADAKGLVIIWRCHGDLTEASSYSLLKKLDIVDKMPIHSIHFCRDHLLIHAEQNILRIVGLKRYKLLHGGFNGVRSGMANIEAVLARMGDGY